MKNFKKHIVPIFLFLFIAVISMWIWNGLRFESMNIHGDGIYHFSRFKYIYENVKEGQFFNDFYREGMLEDFGYPSGIFYPQLILYPFVLLALALSLSPIEGYTLSLTLLLFLTLASSYFAILSFYKKKKVDDKSKRFAATIGALCYTAIPPISLLLSDPVFISYVNFNIFIRASHAEAFAFLFFPWVVVGLYRLVVEEEPNNIFLFSLLGILYSHILSGLFIGICVVLFLALNMKKVSSSRIIKVELIKTFILFLLIGAYQIFPMIEMMLHQDFLYNGDYFDTETLFYQATPIGEVGVSRYFIFVQVIVGILILLGWMKSKKTTAKILMMGVIGWYFSSKFFPWQYLENSAIGFIQFPSRLTFIYNLGISFGIAGKIIEGMFEGKKIAVSALFTIVILLNSVFLYGFTLEINHHIDFTFDEDVEESLFVGRGAEYMPIEVNENFSWMFPSKGFGISENRKMLNHLKEVASSSETLFPKFYYKGYLATVNGKPVEIKKGYSGLIELSDASIEKKDVYLARERTLVQKISFNVAYITFLIYILLSLRVSPSRKFVQI